MGGPCDLNGARIRQKSKHRGLPKQVVKSTNARSLENCIESSPVSVRGKSSQHRKPAQCQKTAENQTINKSHSPKTGRF
jgi:BRCT domain type II-containing protein